MWGSAANLEAVDQHVLEDIVRIRAEFVTTPAELLKKVQLGNSVARAQRNGRAEASAAASKQGPVLKGSWATAAAAVNNNSRPSPATGTAPSTTSTSSSSSSIASASYVWPNPTAAVKTSVKSSQVGGNAVSSSAAPSSSGGSWGNVTGGPGGITAPPQSARMGIASSADEGIRNSPTAAWGISNAPAAAAGISNAPAAARGGSNVAAVGISSASAAARGISNAPAAAAGIRNAPAAAQGRSQAWGGASSSSKGPRTAPPPAASVGAGAKPAASLPGSWGRAAGVSQAVTPNTVGVSQAVTPNTVGVSQAVTPNTVTALGSWARGGPVTHAANREEDATQAPNISQSPWPSLAASSGAAAVPPATHPRRSTTQAPSPTSNPPRLSLLPRRSNSIPADTSSTSSAPRSLTHDLSVSSGRQPPANPWGDHNDDDDEEDEDDRNMRNAARAMLPRPKGQGLPLKKAAAKYRVQQSLLKLYYEQHFNPADDPRDDDDDDDDDDDYSDGDACPVMYYGS